jgi:hypothetical protein
VHRQENRLSCLGKEKKNFWQKGDGAFQLAAIHPVKKKGVNVRPNNTLAIIVIVRKNLYLKRT